MNKHDARYEEKQAMIKRSNEDSIKEYKKYLKMRNGLNCGFLITINGLKIFRLYDDVETMFEYAGRVILGELRLHHMYYRTDQSYSVKIEGYIPTDKMYASFNAKLYIDSYSIARLKL